MAKAPAGEKIEGLSADIQAERLEALRQVVPEAFSERKLDVDKLKTLFSEGVQAGDEEGERFRLEWAGKHKVFDEIAKRTSCTLTLDSDRSSKDFEESKNVFIEGENLEVLRTLQKAYFGKVKMIYIDPPYNTGKDFVYNDNFRQSEAEYCEDTCNVDENGNLKRAYRQNTKDSGRYHSNWLSMMYPRLYLARNLLKDDGVIFVSIDDNEVHNLRALMNEIFGEENFISCFVWHSSTGGGIRSKFVNQAHQYILCFAKSLTLTETFYAPLSEDARKQYKKEDSVGVYREKDFAWKNSSWGVNQKYYIECPDGERVKPKDGYLFRFIESTFMEALSEDKVVFKKTNTSPLINHLGEPAGWNIYIKKYLGDGTGAPSSVIPRDLVGINNEGTTELNNLLGDNKFESPKNVRLLKYLLSLVDSDNNDVVLDFFTGSGTTAQAVMEMCAADGPGPSFVCVQMPEETPDDSEAQKAGFQKISDIAIERIKRAATKIKEENPDTKADLGVQVYRVTDSNFSQWHARSFDSDSELEESLFAHASRVAGGDERARATEVLLKIGHDLNTSIEQSDGFLLADSSIALVLRDDFKVQDLNKVFQTKPRIVIVLERIFTNDDEKINFALRCKEEKVVFQTV